MCPSMHGAVGRGADRAARTPSAEPLDRCDVVAKVPESILNVAANAPHIPYCRQQGKLLTQVKLTGSYTISAGRKCS